MVRIRSRPFHASGKNLWYRLDTRVGGALGRFGDGGKERNLCHCREPNPGRTTRRLVIIVTELPSNVKSKLGPRVKSI
jgi:hypothetical protein